MAKPEYVQGHGFVVEVVRTLRARTARLVVDDGAVVIYVPMSLPDERISRLVTDKKRWVKEKLYLHQQAMPVSSKEFVGGEAFPYLGRNYRLKVQAGPFQPVKLKQGWLVVTMPRDAIAPDMIRSALVRWYRVQAQERLTEKVQRYAKLIGVSPIAVGVKTFKSRWGSCSVRGEILFHWKVIMAPHSIVDYVVAHELCHLKHHDHSPAFWKSVERTIPEYLECKQWLKDVGSRFDI